MCPHKTIKIECVVRVGEMMDMKYKVREGILHLNHYLPVMIF